MNPRTDLPQILIGELARSMGMFIAWFYIESLYSFQSKLGSKANLYYHSENMLEVKNFILMIF